MRAEDVHLIVIGAGPYGLETAAWALTRGYRLTVLERQADVGGDWVRWGNPWSTLQSHRDSYLFSGPVSIPAEAQLPPYPTRRQMLEYFRAFAVLTGVSNNCMFSCTVTGRSPVQDNGKLLVFYINAAGSETSVEGTHIFAAPGRVNRRRELHFHSEAAFRGLLAWGSGCDLAGADFSGKAVVIVGHGSFAIENARHALSQGAISVVMITRRPQLVMTRAAGLFVDRHVDRTMPADAVLDALHKAYALIGLGKEELRTLFFAPSRTVVGSR